MMSDFEFFLKIDGWQKYPNYSIRRFGEEYHVRDSVILNGKTTREKRYWHFMCKFSTFSDALNYLRRHIVINSGKGSHKKSMKLKKQDIIRAFQIFDDESPEIIGLTLLINAMAFATEAGLQPYIEILPEQEYRVYYDWKRGSGKYKDYHLTELENAANWMKDMVGEELRLNPNLAKNFPNR